MRQHKDSNVFISLVDHVDKHQVLVYLSDGECRQVSVPMLRDLPPFRCPDLEMAAEGEADSYAGAR